MLPRPAKTTTMETFRNNNIKLIKFAIKLRKGSLSLILLNIDSIKKIAYISTLMFSFCYTSYILLSFLANHYTTQKTETGTLMGNLLSFFFYRMRMLHSRQGNLKNIFPHFGLLCHAQIT
jgi:hypothetical protein